MAIVVAVVCSLATSACGLTGASPTTTTQPDPTAVYLPREHAAVAAAERAVAVRLPKSIGAPAPSLPAHPFTSDLPAHQVLGFLPYWEVGTVTPDYAGLSSLAYFAVDVARGGSLVETGAGWRALASPSLAAVIAAAHAAGDRVLFTLFSEDPAVIHSLAVAPGPTADKLAAAVATQLRSGGFDGVDLDIEGQSTADRPGFVRFVTSFADRLRGIDPTWSITLNTYPTSAFDPRGFFDVAALAPHVDQLFVMAYDMQNPGVPSATAPLANASLNDALTLAEYTAIVPARKLILGIPLYGYDFPASRGGAPAFTMGTPVAVTYSEIVAAGRKPLWDPASETPWMSFRRGGRWHQTWFDDPVSIALKTALAAQFGLAGVGVWELGMAGGDPQISTALAGGLPPLRLPLAGAG